jgi:adenylate cyclase
VNRTLALIALAVLALFGAERFAVPVLDPLENRLLDGFVRHQAAKLAPDPDIVIVDIDEKSLEAMQDAAGRFPWPREVYATLVEGLAAQKPRAIVFDMLFSEPDRFRAESDAAFVETVAQYDNIFFPMVRLDSRSEARAADVAALLGLVKGPRADPEARIAVIPPLVLPPKLWRTGTINFLADADGVGRRYELHHYVGGWDMLSLPARVAIDLGYPLPHADDMVLAWRGKPDGLPRISFADLYQEFDRSKRTRPADEFKGKVVVVGARAAGLGDLRVTPLSNIQPGAEMLVTAIENLKNGRTMRYAGQSWGAAIGIALIFLLYLAFHRRIDARLIGGALVAVSAALLLLSYLAVGQLVLLPVFTPLVAAWAFYVAAALSEYLREREARREAVAQFSRFLNPHVVQQLLERGGIQPSGQSREVTLLFSDIRGFTTLSESKRPEEVVSLLNRYFSLQVDVVWRHGGTLDKYIGDCIMAIWGAPLDDAQQARNAVACALDMADALQGFKQELGATDASFDVGIGLHTGPAVVGFIGSEKKREYTAIGDTVNLASRIEGLTKDAKRRILVSQDTMERCGDAFDFEPAGSYKVKGRAQEVQLFEPKRKTT